MSFPLGKLDRYDLVSVLNKMEYNSFTNCRRTTSWLHGFIDEHRKLIKTQLHVNWVIFHSTTTCIEIRRPKTVPEEEIMALSPKYVDMQETSKERISSTNFKRFFQLEKVYAHDLEEEALCTLLDKLDKENVNPAICIQRYSKRLYGDSLTKHPVFYKIKDISLVAVIRQPDLAFLSGSHDSVIFTTQTISNVDTFIKAIKTIIDGSNRTRYIHFRMEHDSVSVTDTIIAELEMKLVWSIETHKTSYFKDWNSEIFLGFYIFWSIQMADGKVLGLRIHRSPKGLLFKVFDSEEEFLEWVPNSHLF